MSSIAHENPSADLGTMKCNTELVDIDAMHDSDRRQSLIDFSGHVAVEHHAEQQTPVTA